MKKLNEMTQLEVAKKIVGNEQGRIGYLIAWLCGVPASLLLVIFLLRGH